MIWACFTQYGAGSLVQVEGQMMAVDYIKVLETHLLPFIGGLDKEMFTFQEDNAPVHYNHQS